MEETFTYDDIDRLTGVTLNGKERILTYLTGPYGVFAVVEKSDGEENLHYIYKDHLGSWTTITDSDGKVEQRQSFDAWGNRRNATTWLGAATDEPMFDRGYTGHEHLYAFGLINMNGRMYDPLTSSFLSPDNYVQDPTSQQSFNRYAYCLYNPLRYTDSSGYRCDNPPYWQEVTNYLMCMNDENAEALNNIGITNVQVNSSSGYSGSTVMYQVGDDWYSNHYDGYVDSGYHGSNSNGNNSNGSWYYYNGSSSGSSGSGTGYHGGGCCRGVTTGATGGNNRGSCWIRNDQTKPAEYLFTTCYVQYLIGGKRDIYVDASSMTKKLKRLNIDEDFNYLGDGVYSINLFSDNFLECPDLALALGNIKFKYLGDNMYEILNDDYDFNIDYDDQGNFERTWRNYGTFAGGLLHYTYNNKAISGVSGSFTIHFQGWVYINPRP